MRANIKDYTIEFERYLIDGNWITFYNGKYRDNITMMEIIFSEFWYNIEHLEHFSIDIL